MAMCPPLLPGKQYASRSPPPAQATCRVCPYRCSLPLCPRDSHCISQEGDRHVVTTHTLEGTPTAGTCGRHSWSDEGSPHSSPGVLGVWRCPAEPFTCPSLAQLSRTGSQASHAVAPGELKGSVQLLGTRIYGTTLPERPGVAWATDFCSPPPRRAGARWAGRMWLEKPTRSCLAEGAAGQGAQPGSFLRK